MDSAVTAFSKTGSSCTSSAAFAQSVCQKKCTLLQASCRGLFMQHHAGLARERGRAKQSQAECSWPDTPSSASAYSEQAAAAARRPELTELSSGQKLGLDSEAEVGTVDWLSLLAASSSSLAFPVKVCSALFASATAQGAGRQQPSASRLVAGLDASEHEKDSSRRTWAAHEQPLRKSQSLVAERLKTSLAGP